MKDNTTQLVTVAQRQRRGHRRDMVVAMSLAVLVAMQVTGLLVLL